MQLPELDFYNIIQVHLLNTGLNLNYVHAFPLENDIKIFVGANVFGFREKTCG